MMAANSLVEDHFQRLTRLLNLEAEAEKEESLRDMQRRSATGSEASGNCLRGLVIREQDAGLGGRVLLTLAKRNQSLGLPWTRLGTGSPVILSEEGADSSGNTTGQGWRGIVSRLDKESIQVAFPQWPEPEEEHPTFRLDRSND